MKSLIGRELIKCIRINAEGRAWYVYDLVMIQWYLYTIHLFNQYVILIFFQIWDFNGHCHHILMAGNGDPAEISQVLCLKRIIIVVGWDR